MESIDHALDTYCRHVMTEMGADTTSTSALDHYGRTHFPAHFFAGVYPADREPPPPTGTDFYIQNTEPASHPVHKKQSGKGHGKPKPAQAGAGKPSYRAFVAAEMRKNGGNLKDAPNMPGLDRYPSMTGWNVVVTPVIKLYDRCHT